MGSGDRRERANDPASELTRARQLARVQREANERLVISALRAQDDAAASRAVEVDLRAVAELRERLLGIVGHDLRGPLSAILMGCGLLLRRHTLSADDARVVERIVRSAERMRRLVHDVIDFTQSRACSGLSIAPSPVDMRSLCQLVAEEHALVHATPVVWTTAGDVAGTWDRDRLLQALSNLVGNAVQYADPGTPVALDARELDGDVVVTVTNQGPPIPAELVPHLFDPFRRARQPQAREPTGHLGLGLFIASQIARAHGGTIGADSSHGMTTFVIRLPRCETALPPDAGAAGEP